MGLCRSSGIVAAFLACVGFCSVRLEAAPAASLQRDGSLEIAGRSLRCGKVRNALDPRLPNLGISIPSTRLLVINPNLLRRYPDSVRLFVFHHECGHHHVGASEFKADCWAVDRGVREGWLDKTGLAGVCRSFGNAPETSTHPSGASRCRNLDRCFATATAAVAERERTAPSSARPIVQPAATARADLPALVSGPTLVRNGASR
jgi:hypothetical protein